MVSRAQQGKNLAKSREVEQEEESKSIEESNTTLYVQNWEREIKTNKKKTIIARGISLVENHNYYNGYFSFFFLFISPSLCRAKYSYK